MTGTVCPTCGNWSGNHDPDCVVATTIHAIWAATFGPRQPTSAVEWNRAIEAILVDNAARVATALTGTPDLTAFAEDVRTIVGQEIDNWRVRLDDLDLVPDRVTARVAVLLRDRALVASTGTETDDAQ